MEKYCYSIERLKNFRNKPFIYIRKSDNSQQIFKYDDIIQVVTKCIDFFQENLIENHVGIALDIQEHSATSCIFLLGILNHNCHFYCLDFKATKQVENCLRLSGAKFVISKETLSPELICFEIRYEITIFNEIFYIAKLKTYTGGFLNLKLCYTIATSGSTDLPKMVNVPYECIEPNIKSLSSLLNLHESDIIFLGSPPTFDPFVVELFLSLENGAAILITSGEMRRKSQYLLKILFPSNSTFKGITVLQTTPSLFRLFGSQDIQNSILSSNSSLRCLILGGEEFPSYSELKSWLPLDFALSGKRIFNIYGITEVSCWSTISEFDLNKHLNYTRMPLGAASDDYTILRITDKDYDVIPNNCAKGELLIGSSKRRCFIPEYDQSISILESTDFVYRKTGDLVEVDKFGNIYYIARLNNTIKRLGKRLCLDSLSKKLENLLNTTNKSKVVCLWHEESVKLMFCITSRNSTTKQKEGILHLIKCNLEKHEQPDEIYYNDEMPLNNNGKIDRKKLMDQILTKKQNQNKTALQIFKDFLENVMDIKIENEIKEEYATNHTKSRKRVKYDLSKLSFINAGGNSFQALSLATEIVDRMESPEEQRKILEMLLDSNKTIKDILEFLSSATNKLVTNKTTFYKPTNLSHSIKLLWRCDFKKCIDASPTICQEKFIIVGSHSHLLLSLDVNSGNEISRLDLPDRIECSVVYVSSDLALVGCYDGFLYGFNFNNGSIVFKMNLNGMIKAKPLLINNTIIVGSYAEEFNVMAFDIKTLECLWSIKLGSKGIFSSPLKISEKSVLLCSLDGSYALAETSSGCLKWLQKLESPIFSTPAEILASDNFLVIAEVKGQISVCNEKNGEKITSYQADGNIFSSLTIHQHTPNNTLIIFGCHDKNLYCVNFENATRILTLSWKFFANSPIYATPILLSSRYVLACSTKGFIMLLDLETSDLKASYDLKAEVFSTPCSLSDKFVYVGARDNFLYAFELE